MFVPAAVASLVGISAWVAHKRSKKGQMTPTRQKVFNKVLTDVKEPAKLETMSKAYQKEGLTEQAQILAARAKSAALSPEKKQARRVIFKKGMKLQDPAKVNVLAEAFRKQGAVGAAAALKQYGAGLPKKVA